MTLAEFMKERSMRDGQMAALLGCDTSMVWRWRNAKRYPDPPFLRAIFAATDGKVSANDFFHAAVTEAAE